MSDDPRPSGARARKVVALLVVVAALGIDLLTKQVMADRLGMDSDQPDRSEVIEVVPGFFRLQGHWNPGITFGLMPNKTEAILTFTVAACLGILGVLLFTRARSALLHVSLAMILGGALGNLYDRWKWQQVRDFLVVYWKDPSIWQWPAFNAADSFIVVGVILLLARELFGRPPPAPAPAGAP